MDNKIDISFISKEYYISIVKHFQSIYMIYTTKVYVFNFLMPVFVTFTCSIRLSIPAKLSSYNYLLLINIII